MPSSQILKFNLQRAGVPFDAPIVEAYFAANSKSGIKPTDLHNLPENDHWIYPTLRNGEPYQSDVSICNVFTCKILKEAGIFGIVVMDSCNKEIFPFFANLAIVLE